MGFECNGAVAHHDSTTVIPHTINRLRIKTVLQELPINASESGGNSILDNVGLGEGDVPGRRNCIAS